MTKDEILQALRLTAMGRTGHPLQDQLAEKLEAVFAREQVRDEARAAGDELMASLGFPSLSDIPDGSVSPTETPLMASAKKLKDAIESGPFAPKRRKKAD